MLFNELMFWLENVNKMHYSFVAITHMFILSSLHTDWNLRLDPDEGKLLFLIYNQG